MEKKDKNVKTKKPKEQLKKSKSKKTPLQEMSFDNNISIETNKTFKDIDDWNNLKNAKKVYRVAYQTNTKPPESVLLYFQNKKDSEKWFKRLREFQDTKIKNLNHTFENLDNKGQLQPNSLFVSKNSGAGILITKEDIENYKPEIVQKVKEEMDNTDVATQISKEEAQKVKEKQEPESEDVAQIVEEPNITTTNTTKTEEIVKEKTETPPKNEEEPIKSQTSTTHTTNNSSTPNDKAQEEGLEKYQRLFKVEDDLIKHIKENYHIPKGMTDERLLDLIHHNFTASKIGNLDVRNWNDLIDHNKLYLYDYVDIDKDGNLVNKVQGSNSDGIVFEPKVKDKSNLSPEELKKYHKEEEENKEKLLKLRDEFYNIQPLIFHDLMNHSVEQRLDYLKRQMKNAKKPVNLNRGINFLTDLVKNKYLFIGAMFFSPSLFVGLGIALLTLKFLQYADYKVKTRAQKKRIKNIQKLINRDVDGLKRDLKTYFNKGKELSELNNQKQSQPKHIKYEPLTYQQALQKIAIDNKDNPNVKKTITKTTTVEKIQTSKDKKDDLDNLTKQLDKETKEQKGTLTAKNSKDKDEQPFVSPILDDRE